MIQPKKSLGQHFLTNKHYCTRIIELASVNQSDKIFEIGPGTGALTSFLLENSLCVTALEFDRDMVEALEHKYQVEINSTPPRLWIHQGNVLKTNWKPLLLEILPGQESSDSIAEVLKPKVVGNLPYNISTRILEHSIEFKNHFQSFTFMTQKEVSARILASPGSSDYGYFSLLMDFNFQRIKGFDVPPNSFYPPPKVMSHVMQLRPRFIETEAEKEFIQLTKIGFSQRRKTIFNNLISLFHDKKLLSSVLEECDIPERSRAQELNLEQFLAISEVSRRVLSFKA
jgi:16S rRNA (adenine1518-N6/adenine1519-N6)-dimethyltransferase